MTEHQDDEGVASVAIIGMAGRFPGAATVDIFWQNLRQGVESIRPFTAEELRESGILPELSGHPNYVNAKGVLDNATLFDAAFFGINRREAEVTDPQQRVFLECAWEALEAAGYDPEAFAGSIGVYAGIGMNSYLLSNVLGNQALLDAVGSYQMLLGNDKDFLATRVSYKLNLRGPSLVIQTACSTSLVAVQAAYQALLDFQCDMALAGGVSIEFPQKVGYLYQEGMIMSPDGHCRAFDAKAKGTVGGEGAGVVVLKRLEDALQARDNILAVIRGAAINNDGSAKIGFTAPSVEGQAEVIATAQSLAGVSPETIGFIEAHGTGTPLGDPIEVAALTRAFRMNTSKTGFCALGSVKTNIGHLNTAAGVAGLIKTVLALQHRQIPPSLHFQQPNPETDFANTPFYVNTALTDWKQGSSPRRAGVSSFGMGGTNVHVVLEEAPPTIREPSRRTHHVLLLSAKSAEALDAATDNLSAALGNDADLDLADAAYTLQIGRKHFQHRRIVVGRDRAEASELLAKRDSKRVFTASRETAARPVVFLLTGQGSQAVGMAREVYQLEPEFRKHLDYCIQRLTPLLGMDLRAVLYPEERDVQAAEEQLRQTRLAQPAIFSIDYALAMLWMHWGIRPSALLGHSLGEYVAACLAGVFSLDDALDLVAERGRLMQSLPGGAMLSVPLRPEALASRLGGDLSLAAVNAPDLCVASGPCDAVERLQQSLKSENLDAQRLRTSHAFHSAMMDGIVDAFVRKVAAIPLRPPALPVMSNLSGTWLSPQQATDPGYWARHLRNPVQFSASVAELLSDPTRVFLEVGPGRTLISLARRQAPAGGNHLFLSSLPHPQDRVPDSLAMFTALGRMWASGVDVDWRAFHSDEPRSRVVLPSYPFQRSRFYSEPRKPSPVRPVSGEDRPAKIQDISRWFYVPSWRRTAPSAALPRGDAVEGGGRWLLFLDTLGMGDALAERLRPDGTEVILVRAGRSFSRLDDHGYVLDPGERAHYDELFADLASRDRLPSRMVHLFTVAGDDQGSEALLNRGFYSLLYSVQSLIRVRPAHPLAIDVVSNASQDVSGNEPVCPEKAAVNGLCRVIPQEFGNLRCRNTDISVPGGKLDGTLISQFVAELTSNSSDPVVALRDGQRWVQHFEPLILPSGGARSRFREGGVYLITGGLGAIGLLIAAHIARSVRARFVLAGRTDLPPRSEWSASTADSLLARRIAAIRAIEDLGSEVLPVRADVADESAMRAVLHKIDASFGALHGVIHAAGATGPEDFVGITELDRPRCQRHFRAKLDGTRVLERVLHGRPLDFCVLTSSLAAVLGGLGFAAYAAANGFMDAFAHECNRGIPWIAIDWDGWFLARESPAADVESFAMTPEEGVETLDRILGGEGLRRVVVSTGNLSRRFEQWVGPGGKREQGVASNEADAGTSEPEADAAVAAFGSKTEATVAAIWRDVLGVSRIGPHDDFFELGGHSLLATQLLARIRAALGADLPVRLLFETRTIAALAGAVEARLWQEKAGAAVVSGGDREEFEI